MKQKRILLTILASASKNSSNLKLIELISKVLPNSFELVIFDQLKELPHFDAEQTLENTPQKICDIRNLILNADGVLICSPEYVFSIPSGLKNLIEWCVSTTVFSNKHVGLITAAADGRKAHEELKLIMKTIEAKFSDETTLLIQGVRGKFDENGNLKNKDLMIKLDCLIQALCHEITNKDNITRQS